ncbi:MAG: CinA family nicotinamide mononucleotide deamidase-related protein [Paludibacteraceae bacterium]|nr:CinA family nicotinamide mononucleotide deamidase-related protein [Paludibacteraceae bacterium]
MQAEIITIGDELLIGQVVDTNSAFMAQQLNSVGVEVERVVSVHDDAEQIAQALDDALTRADIVITTGGLGPTKDDITKHVLCNYFHTRLVPDADVEANIRRIYADRPQVLNRLTETQWLVPENCRVLQNRVGSAPLMYWHLDDGRQVFCLPGVPYEMEIAIREQILPVIKSQISNLKFQINHRTILVSGIPESSLAIVLEDWENALPEGLHLAYLPKDGTIRLRLSGYGVPTELVEQEKAKLMTLVREWFVAEEDKPLEVLVGERLKALGKTISTAESCTGGTLASMLARHPGSSQFYWGSVVSYDNSVKANVLGVNKQDLQTYGAVSEQVVRQMADGVRRLCGTDYAIATSGIAGPTGGTADKPVGTVWIAWATPQGTTAECFHLGSLREQVIARTCSKALIGLLHRLA